MGVKIPESVILKLVGQIYDAACNAELWPAFLEKFADVAGGTATQIFLYDAQRRSGNIATAVRSDSAFLKRYDEYYIGVDCFGTNGRELIATGNVVTGQMMCPDSILDNSEFYNDFLRAEDTFHQFCGFICQEQSVASVISVLRPRRMGPFGDGHVQLLQALMPHLQRAVQIHRRIAVLENKARAGEEALGRVPVGFLAIDAEGKVLMSNRRAQLVLEQNDGLTLGRNGLITRRAEETDRLRALIHGAIAGRPATGFPGGGVMTVTRLSRRRPFEVLVAPLRHEGSSLWAEKPAAAIFLNDPETVPEGKERILTRLFGFSAAEARLAAALMQGKSLEESAEDLQISRNTVRTQLQHMFDKTGTRRQAELVRLLSNSLAQLRFDLEMA